MRGLESCLTNLLLVSESYVAHEVIEVMVAHEVAEDTIVLQREEGQTGQTGKK
jgi:hypothetical protein